MAEVRILSHMNKDHRLAIEDYLVVYGKVPITDKISNIKLTAIDTKQMTITFAHEDVEFDVEKVIPFEPELESLSEARTRLVEMAKFAASERGFSHFQIAEFMSPLPYQLALIGVIYLPIASYFFPSILKNSFVTKHLLSEAKADWLLKHALKITGLTLGIHALEDWFILKPKLAKFRVPIDFQLEWYLSGLLEGFGAVKRFNMVVASKEH